jgi:hypothetical protein
MTDKFLGMWVKRGADSEGTTYTVEITVAAETWPDALKVFKEYVDGMQESDDLTGFEPRLGSKS